MFLRRLCFLYLNQSYITQCGSSVEKQDGDPQADKFMQNGYVFLKCYCILFMLIVLTEVGFNNE